MRRPWHHPGLEERLTLAIAPELLAARWTGRATLAQEYPLLQVEVLTARRAMRWHCCTQAVRNWRWCSSGPASTGARVSGSRHRDAGGPSWPLITQCWSRHAQPPRPGPAPACALLREEHLTTTRQIVVASRDLAQTDPRFVFARHHWRTDKPPGRPGPDRGRAGLGWQPRPWCSRASRPDGW